MDVASLDVTVDFMLDGGRRTEVLQADLSSSDGSGAGSSRTFEIFLPPTRVQRVEVDVSPAVAGVSLGYSDRQPYRPVPTEFILHPNYPNPFRDQTSFVVDIPRSEGDDPFAAQSTPRLIEVRIYNVLGREVRRFSLDVPPGGRMPITWDGRDFLGRPLPSGVYFYRIHTESWRSSFQRALLLR
jgi:hypothetical protein